MRHTARVTITYNVTFNLSGVQKNLETAMRRARGWCEMAARLGVQQLEVLVQLRNCSEKDDGH